MSETYPLTHDTNEALPPQFKGPSSADPSWPSVSAACAPKFRAWQLGMGQWYREAESPEGASTLEPRPGDAAEIGQVNVRQTHQRVQTHRKGFKPH